jgi:hypothetical protein
MIKRLLFAGAIFSSVITYAQELQPLSSDFYQGETTEKSTSRSKSDTIGINEFAPDGKFNVYFEPQEGYVFGTNHADVGIGLPHGFNEVVQAYQTEGEVVINELLILFGEAELLEGDPNFTEVTVRIYEMIPNMATGGRFSDGGIKVAGPTKILRDEFVALKDIAPAKENEYAFTSIVLETPLVAPEYFAVGIYFENLYETNIGQGIDRVKDSVAVMSDFENVDGAADNIYVYLRRTEQFYTINYLYDGSYNGHLGMFAVIDGNNIDEEHFFNDVKMMYSYPNPASDEMTITYELKNSMDKLKFQLLGSDGKLVKSIEFNGTTSGVFNETINVSDLAAGHYYYSIISDKGRIVKKFVKH